MSDNFIIEDFSMSQVEFEKRYNTVQACIDYLAKVIYCQIIGGASLFCLLEN